MLKTGRLKTLTYAVSICFIASPLSYAESTVEQPSLNVAPKSKSHLQATDKHNISKIFSPQKATLDYRFDYQTLDTALGNIVIQMGPSLRRFKKKPRSKLGSRIQINSQNSPYRLEGSRIDFHGLSNTFKRRLSEYKDDLIRLANEIDIQSLNRDEQLAFWMNLHNVVLIDAIAKNHPTSYPALLKIGKDKQLLHDAKLVTIQNIPLSLKNIREDIVYSNWNDPLVIYGFFRGDIGGPVLKEYALTKYNIDYVLPANTYEYMTSLRGFHTTRKARKFSKLYDEARPYFFPNWPQDLEAHFKDQLQFDALLKDVIQSKPLKIIKYDNIIADLWGGNKTSSSATINSSHAPIGASSIILDRSNKIRELKRKRKLKKSYTVTIKDIDTSSQADADTPAEPPE